MVIVYYGRLEQLTKELEETRDTLNHRYIKILGQERANKVTDTAKRILGPESFFETTNVLNSYLGYKLPPNTPNKMGLFTRASLELDSRDRLKDRKIRTSIGFYISENGFQYGSSSKFTERMIASYVHEFNHFVYYALQRVPLELVSFILFDKIQARKQPIDIGDYVAQIEEVDLPHEEIFKRLGFAAFSQVLHDSLEQATRVLDKMILESIGINVPLEWRGMERLYQDIQLPTGQILRTGVGGDPFKNLEDKEIIEQLLEWEKYLNPVTRVSSVHNLVESLKGIKVSRVPLQELFKVK